MFMDKTNEILSELSEVMDYNNMSDKQREKLGVTEHTLVYKQSELVSRLLRGELNAGLQEELKRIFQNSDIEFNTLEKCHIISQRPNEENSIEKLLRQLGGSLNYLFREAAYLSDDAIKDMKNTIINAVKENIEKITKEDLLEIREMRVTYHSKLSKEISNNE